MNRRGADNAVVCEGECSGCKLVSPGDGALRGWRLVLVAAGVFIMPLVLAVLGAAVAPGEATAQMMGAGIGLLVGILAAAATGTIIRRTGRQAPPRIAAAPEASPEEEIS